LNTEVVKIDYDKVKTKWKEGSLNIDFIWEKPYKHKHKNENSDG
jgi:hypothetical protein